MEHTDEVVACAFVGERHAITLQRGVSVSDNTGSMRHWDLASGREVMPKVLLSGYAPKQVFILNDGKSALTSGRGDTIDVFPLNDLFVRESTLEANGRLSELISGRALPTRGGQPLTSAEWLERWSDGLRSGELAPLVAIDWSTDAHQSWHRQQQRLMLYDWRLPKAALWHAAQLNHSSIEAQLELVTRNMNLGRFNEGLSALDRVLERAPGHSQALSLRQELQSAMSPSD